MAAVDRDQPWFAPRKASGSSLIAVGDARVADVQPRVSRNQPVPYPAREAHQVADSECADYHAYGLLEMRLLADSECQDHDQARGRAYIVMTVFPSVRRPSMAGTSSRLTRVIGGGTMDPAATCAASWSSSVAVMESAKFTPVTPARASVS